MTKQFRWILLGVAAMTTYLLFRRLKGLEDQLNRHDSAREDDFEALHNLLTVQTMGLRAATSRRTRPVRIPREGAEP